MEEIAQLIALLQQTKDPQKRAKIQAMITQAMAAAEQNKRNILQQAIQQREAQLGGQKPQSVPRLGGGGGGGKGGGSGIDPAAQRLRQQELDLKRELALRQLETAREAQRLQAKRLEQQRQYQDKAAWREMTFKKMMFDEEIKHQKELKQEEYNKPENVQARKTKMALLAQQELMAKGLQPAELKGAFRALQAFMKGKDPELTDVLAAQRAWGVKLFADLFMKSTTVETKAAIEQARINARKAYALEQADKTQLAQLNATTRAYASMAAKNPALMGDLKAQEEWVTQQLRKNHSQLWELRQKLEGKTPEAPPEKTSETSEEKPQFKSPDTVPQAPLEKKSEASEEKPQFKTVRYDEQGNVIRSTDIPDYEVPQDEAHLWAGFTPDYEVPRREAPKWADFTPNYEVPQGEKGGSPFIASNWNPTEMPDYEVPRHEVQRWADFSPDYEVPQGEERGSPFIASNWNPTDIPNYEVPQHEAPKWADFTPGYEVPQDEAPKWADFTPGYEVPINTWDTAPQTQVANIWSPDYEVPDDERTQDWWDDFAYYWA